MNTRTNTIRVSPPRLLRNRKQRKKRENYRGKRRKREEVGDNGGGFRVEVPLCSRGFVLFNVVFALIMVLLMYLVIVVRSKENINDQSPTVTKESCSSDLKQCLMDLLIDSRRYLDFYY